MDNKKFLERINQSALKFLQPLSVKETLTTIAKEAKKLIDAKHSSIFVNKNNKWQRVYTTFPRLYEVIVTRPEFISQTFNTDNPTFVSEDQINKLIPELQQLHFKSNILIPLSYKNTSFGVLSLLFNKQQKATNETINLFKLFGSMATLAIKKAQLHEETLNALESRDKYKTLETTLEKIQKASLKFLIPLTPEETYKTIVEEAIKLVDGNNGTIFLRRNGEMKNAYGSSPQAAKFVPRKRGFTYTSFLKRQAFVASVDDWGRYYPKVRKKGIKSAVFIPLFYRSKSIGVLLVHSFKNKMFAEKELEILKLFGSLASLGIRKTQLYSETKNALELRDLFIPLAAHELRTPITSIYGYAQLLHKKKGEGIAPQTHWVDQLYGESTRLSRLVNELLEINRIQTGRLQFSWQECKFPEIVERAINTIHFNHPQHKMVFQNKTNSDDDVVIGDYDKLIQVVINLLDNAAKFSPIDKPITIMVKSLNTSLKLTVHDRGKGIHSEDLPKVFQGFYKGKENFEMGMGLGLYLAKNIVEQHHGTIAIHSELNKGTIAEVTIPKTKV